MFCKQIVCNVTFFSNHEFNSMKTVYKLVIDELNKLREEISLKDQKLNQLESQYQQEIDKYKLDLEKLQNEHNQQMENMKNALLHSSRSEKALLDQLREREDMIKNLMKRLSTLSELENKNLLDLKHFQVKQEDKSIQTVEIVKETTPSNSRVSYFQNILCLFYRYPDLLYSRHLKQEFDLEHQ